MALLALNNIEVVYDNLFLAAKGISIEVPEGGLVALLGANGAGKSTVLKSISGLLAAERGKVTRGEMLLRGVDMLSMRPPERVRSGIAHVLEGRRVFEHLTPAENLLSASTMHSDRKKVQQLIERVFAWFPRLSERASSPAGYLSGGEQQMLAIARGILAKPKILMIDEVSLGLAPKILQFLFPVLTHLNEAGLSILLVEQLATEALAVTSRAYVMEGGKVTISGNSTDLTHDPRIMEAYLGKKYK